MSTAIRIWIFTLVFLTMLVSCLTHEKAAPFSGENEIQHINNLMQEQEDAWNNGDIDGFMKHYWNSDSLVFVGASGITRGWQKTLDNYKKFYPNRERMGRLEFKNVEVDVEDLHHAWVLGSWTLFRTSDTLSGYYTLKWRRINGKWVIVADHSS